jgi:hypothetical protein
MRSALIVITVFCTVLFSSCFVRTRRVLFKADIPLTSEHGDFNRDSLSCHIAIEPDSKNMVIPFLIFSGDKKKARITYSLHGKGISAREYTCKFIHLEIKSENTVIGRSKDSLLFDEKKEPLNLKSAVSPFYATRYLLKLSDPNKLHLYMEIEFEAINRRCLKDTFRIKTPLEGIRIKSFNRLKFLSK